MLQSNVTKNRGVGGGLSCMEDCSLSLGITLNCVQNLWKWKTQHLSYNLGKKWAEFVYLLLVLIMIIDVKYEIINY